MAAGDSLIAVGTEPAADGPHPRVALVTHRLKDLSLSRRCPLVVRRSARQDRICACQRAPGHSRPRATGANGRPSNGRLSIRSRELAAS